MQHASERTWSLTPAAFRCRVLLLIGTALAAFAALLAVKPIPQPAAYHNFADVRALLGIPNLLNVISNAPFAIIGGLGLGLVLSKKAAQAGGLFLDPRARWPFVVLFVGVALTALGSGYYHYQPDTPRLFWDRLPMSVAFMAVLTAVITERISVPVGLWLLGPLVALGAASVLYWQWSELHGHGDLRFYLFVQAYPALAVPLILLLFPPRYTRTADWFVALGWYVLAKVLEEADRPIFALGTIVSGHTLKHLAAAMGAYWVLRMLQERRPLAQPAANFAG